MHKYYLLMIALLAGQPLFSQGTFTINGAQLTVGGAGTIVLNNTEWVNNGTFAAGNGTVILAGDAANQAVGGSSATTFYNLEVDKSGNGAQLGQAVTVENELQMTSGNLNLNGFDLTLGAAGTIAGESADSYIHGNVGGEIIKTQNLNAPSAVNPGNLGAAITSAADLGATTIRRGHQPQTIYGSESINRYYDITPANNSNLDATLRLSYLNHELNGIPEDELEPQREDGGTWQYYDVLAADTVANYVETDGIQSFSRWTLARGALSLMPAALLQGPYAGSGLMADNLRSGGLLPGAEPYTGLGYTYINGGGESADPSVFNVSGNDAIVDWVVLELRDKTNQTIVVQSRAALLQRDGDIVDVDGASAVAFHGLPEDEYYLAVKHRNHLGAMSATPVLVSRTPTLVDFTGDQNNVFGGQNGVSDLGDGNFGLYSGDFNRNGQVQNTDYAAMVQTLGTAGYIPGDLNLNGQVQNTDLQLELVPNIGRGQPFGQ